jgi:DnaJ like chaperone protein
MKHEAFHIVAGRLAGLAGGILMFGTLFEIAACIVAGFVCDVLYARFVFPQRNRDRLMQTYSQAVVELCAKMCKADGVVTKEEIDAFRRSLVVSPDDMRLVSVLFNHAKNKVDGFEEPAKKIATILRHRPQELMILLEVLYEIALSDRYVAPGERAFILKVAQIFGLTPAQVNEMEHRLSVGTRQNAAGEAAYEQAYRSDESNNPFQKSAISGKDPHKILGTQEGATKDEIKRAYRKLVAKNHPDKLRGDGASEAEINRAETRMTELNAAYAELMKRL